MPTPVVRRRRRRPAGDPQTVCAYVRVSTSAQAESGVGLAAQRHAITTAATQAGLTIVEWFEDAGISGAKLANRPGLLAALDAIADGRAGGLIVAKIDRLGRSLRDVAGLVEASASDGWRLIALDVGLDMGTPAGELVANVVSAAARFEHRRIGERQREKFDALRRAGRVRAWPPADRALADALIAQRATGATYRAIVADLEARGVPTVKGGRWAPATVRSIIVTRERELAAQAAA